MAAEKPFADRCKGLKGGERKVCDFVARTRKRPVPVDKIAKALNMDAFKVVEISDRLVEKGVLAYGRIS